MVAGAKMGIARGAGPPLPAGDCLWPGMAYLLITRVAKFTTFGNFF
jgi:hypothetical protein